MSYCPLGTKGHQEWRTWWALLSATVLTPVQAIFSRLANLFSAGDEHMRYKLVFWSLIVTVLLRKDGDLCLCHETWWPRLGLGQGRVQWDTLTFLLHLPWLLGMSEAVTFSLPFAVCGFSTALQKEAAKQAVRKPIYSVPLAQSQLGK